MNCDRFEEIMLEDLSGEQNESDNAELLKHLSECRDCRNEYDQLQDAMAMIKPQPGDCLTPIERLMIENRIYKARLAGLRAAGSRASTLGRRAFAVAAALLLFFLGFSFRSLYDESHDLGRDASVEEKLGDVIRRQNLVSSGQRISPKGLLLIARGKKAIEQYK